MTILVVEDDVNGRRLLRLFLERCGHRVEVAGDGAEALAAIGRQMPALVITDLNMPNVDGHELIRRLRADAATARIPILVISAAWDAAGPAGSRVPGSDAFLPKPFDLPLLSDAVARLLAGGTDEG